MTLSAKLSSLRNYNQNLESTIKASAERIAMKFRDNPQGDLNSIIEEVYWGVTNFR